MGKIMCVSDSYPEHPRLEKIAEYFNQDLNYYIIYVLWDRIQTESNDISSKYIYKSKASYGDKMAKLFKLPGFSLHILKTILREKPQIIICRHWPVYLILAFTYFGKAKIIYDVCDMPSNALIRFIEKIAIKRANTVVLASRFFKDFYKSEKVLILENRLRKKITKEVVLNKKSSNKFNITYLGKIRYYPILKRLVDSIKDNPNIELNFYGDGPDFNKLRYYCVDNNTSNIEFHGRYDQEEIPQIYNLADLIWCAYPNDNFNVKYAISNKFFETLAFEVPGIFSGGTKLAEEVSKHGIGFTVDPYKVSDIKRLIEMLHEQSNLIDNAVRSIQRYSNNVYWEDYYIRSDIT